MPQLLIATLNPGKLAEFAALLASLPVTLLSPADVGLTFDVLETGQTYAENARLKAEAFALASGLAVIADDSGLEVDALAGRPGLYSARYAGPGASDADRRLKLVQELRHIPPPRTARFVCVAAVALPGHGVQLFEGLCPGEIVLTERGSGGFGYDPLFWLPEHQATLAELAAADKHQLSHRGRAVRAALPYLRQALGVVG